MRCHQILKAHGLLDRPKEYLVRPHEKEEIRFLSSSDGRLRELEELVHALYIIDREYSETRSLTFKVNNTEIWTELKDVIEALYSFLTNRFLELKIEKTQSSRSLQTVLLGASASFAKRPTVTCLFSGGMDSTAGVLKIGHMEEPLLHHTITGKVIKGKVCRLHDLGPLNEYGLALTDSQLRNIRPGRSSLRGLLFLTNASIIANSFDHTCIVMAENGPLMINPQVSQLSPRPTLNAHPFLVKCFERILRRLTDKKFEITCIFKEKTKAEIFALTTKQADLINKTYSCFTVQGQEKMCGICYACFVRRVSALSINHREPQILYSMDPFSIDIGELGNRSVQKMNILKDSLSFFRDILFDDALVEQVFEDIPKGFFSCGQSILRRFAEDIFLGTKNYLAATNRSRLNALGKFAALMIEKEIDKDVLVRRNMQLQQQLKN